MVFGGAGFIGTELSFMLGRRFGKENVVVVDNFSNECGKELLVSYGYKVIKADSIDKVSIEVIIENECPDVIYYLANSRCGDDSGVANSNYLGLCNVAEICCVGKISFLFISSGRVYGDVKNTIYEKIGCKENFRYNPQSADALSDMICEVKIISLGNISGLNYAIIRACDVFSINNCYSPIFYRFMSSNSFVSFDVCENWSLSFTEKVNSEERQWVHVEELCKAVDVIGDFLMYDYEHVRFCGNIFNVNGAEKIKSIDLIELISNHKLKGPNASEHRRNIIKESSLCLDGSLISSAYGLECKRKITEEIKGGKDVWM